MNYLNSLKVASFFIVFSITMSSAAQMICKGLVTTPDGRAVADVAITIKDRPTYFSDRDGHFAFAATTEDGEYTIERVEKPGYKLTFPTLPYVSSNGEGWTTNIVMECEESEQQKAVREYGEQLYEKAMEQERKRLYGDAADSLVKRANLDTLNARWQYETGFYMHKYRDYRSAQTYYNRAISAAKPYGEKNQLLAMCYEAYGDNYCDWKVWGEESNLNYGDAKTYYVFARNYWFSLYGLNCNPMARIYIKLSNCWKGLENESMQKDYLDKALQTLDNTPDALLSLYALVYWGYVGLYYPAGKYEETLLNLQKLLVVEKEMYGEESEYYKRIARYIEEVKEKMKTGQSNGE